MEDVLIRLINMIGTELPKGSQQRAISGRQTGRLIIRLFII